MCISTRTTIAFIALAALAACDRSQPAAPVEAPAPVTEIATPVETPPVQAAGGLALEGEGLRLFDSQGAARAIPFGTAQATVIAAVAASTSRPAPAVTTNEECGAGPIQFVEFHNGLQLLFQNNTFQGWFIDKAGLTTADGMGVGSTRASAEGSRTIEMVADSTLEGEFTSGDLGGFLSAATPQGTVTSLYAGLTCFFR